MTLWLRLLARGATFVAPLALFAFVLLGVYAYAGNPVLDSFATTSLLTVPIAGWLGLALLDGGEPALLELAGVRRGRVRVAVERAAAGVLLIAVLAAVAVLAPTAAGAFETGPSAGQLASGWLAHLACGGVGLGLAACASRGVGPFARASVAAAAVLAAQLALVVAGLPPMGLVDALHDGDPLAGPLLATGALALALLALPVGLAAARDAPLRRR